MSGNPLTAHLGSGPAHTRPMTVLVNLCWLVPGVVGGSEEATTNALRALIASAPEDLDLQLAVLEPFLEAHPDLASSVPHHVLVSDGSNKVLRVGAEQWWLARLARRLRVDVVHHAGGVVPLVHPGRIVLTLHDLQPLDMPENFSWPKRTYLRAMLGRSARAADVVCVPSAFTGSRVVELLGVPSNRVVEVPWSTGPVQAADPASAQVESGAGAGARGRYLLYPAITYPHKRHLLLLDAFALIADSHPDVDLILTGGHGPLHEQVLSRIAALGLSARVSHLGRIPATDLAELYRHAEAVVLPSSYEGFGMPALEAMAHGCPVVASDSGSLSEVVPATGIVRDDDPRSWADAIETVLSLDKAQRADRVRTGKQTVMSFGPESTAAALAAAYRRAVHGQNQPEES